MGFVLVGKEEDALNVQIDLFLIQTEDVYKQTLTVKITRNKQGNANSVTLAINLGIINVEYIKFSS